MSDIGYFTNQVKKLARWKDYESGYTMRNPLINILAQFEFSALKPENIPCEIEIDGKNISYSDMNRINELLNPAGIKTGSLFYATHTDENRYEKFLIGQLSDNPETVDEVTAFIVGKEFFSNWPSDDAVLYLPEQGIIGRERIARNELERYIKDDIKSIYAAEKCGNPLADEEYQSSIVFFAKTLGVKTADVDNPKSGARKIVRNFLTDYYIPREREFIKICDMFSNEVIDQLADKLGKAPVKYECGDNRIFEYDPKQILRGVRNFLADAYFIEKHADMTRLVDYALYRFLKRLGFKAHDPEFVYVNCEKVEKAKNTRNPKEQIMDEIKNMQEIQASGNSISIGDLERILALEFDAIFYFKYLNHKRAFE